MQSLYVMLLQTLLINYVWWSWPLQQECCSKPLRVEGFCWIHCVLSYKLGRFLFCRISYNSTRCRSEKVHFKLGTNNRDHFNVSISNCISSGYRDFWGYLIIQALSGFGNGKDWWSSIVQNRFEGQILDYKHKYRTWLTA